VIDGTDSPYQLLSVCRKVKIPREKKQHAEDRLDGRSEKEVVIVRTEPDVGREAIDEPGFAGSGVDIQAKLVTEADVVLPMDIDAELVRAEKLEGGLVPVIGTMWVRLIRPVSASEPHAIQVIA
jgi:hypothetical protein